jgi:hypothetical protein
MERDNAVDLQSLILRQAFGYAESKGVLRSAVKRTARDFDRWSHSDGQIGERDEDHVAIGISQAVNGKKDAHRIAVYVQDSKMLKSKLLSEIGALVGGGAEIDIVETGIVRALSWHTEAVSPMRLGCSVGHQAGGVGTVGCFVKDLDDDAICILTNRHVLQNATAELPNGQVFQPGGAAGRPIAVLKEWKDLEFGPQGRNQVDCAIATIATGFIDFDPRQVCDNVGAVIAPDLSKIAAAASLNETVSKVGQATRFTKGAVIDTDVMNLKVIYDGQSAMFDHQIAVTGLGNKAFARSGDSGSLVLNGQHEPVGLLFAASAGGGNGKGIAYANPIKTVLELMRVEIN